MSTKSLTCLVLGVVIFGAGSLVTMSGCSPTVAIAAGKIGYKAMKKEGNIRVFVDGQRASQNKLKKAITKAKWKISDPVSTTPTVRFIFLEPEEIGQITFSTISLFPEVGDDYAYRAAFTLTPRSTDPASQLKPNTSYDLGSPPATLRVLDSSGDEVSGVSLQPGQDYMLQLTITAARSETMRVYFETK